MLCFHSCIYVYVQSINNIIFHIQYGIRASSDSFTWFFFLRLHLLLITKHTISPCLREHRCLHFNWHLHYLLRETSYSMALQKRNRHSSIIHLKAEYRSIDTTVLCHIICFYNQRVVSILFIWNSTETTLWLSWILGSLHYIFLLYGSAFGPILITLLKNLGFAFIQF